MISGAQEFPGKLNSIMSPSSHGPLGHVTRVLQMVKLCSERVGNCLRSGIWAPEIYGGGGIGRNLERGRGAGEKREQGEQGYGLRRLSLGLILRGRGG